MSTGRAGKRDPGSTPAAMRWPATWGDGWWQEDEGDWTMFLSPWPVLSDVVCGPSAAVGQNRDAVRVGARPAGARHWPRRAGITYRALRKSSTRREQCGGIGVVGRQRAVGEVVLVAGVEEQLRVFGLPGELTGGVDVALAGEDRVGVHPVHLHRHARGPGAERGDRDAGIEQ